jgi:tRNA nucleotidyltransferase (CCA-adding enzyme)
METRIDKSYGVVPIFKSSDGFLFCLIKHNKGHWGFPKGHKHENESDEETALRELKEETGIAKADLLHEPYFIEQYSFEKNAVLLDKSVKYFLGSVSSMTSETPDSFKKEIPELRWGNYEETRELLTFPQAREVLEQVTAYLKSSAS